MVEECSLLARTYCDEIWTGRNMTSFLVKLQANKTLRRLSFVSNFKKMTFARFFSLDFSSKSPWCRPFSIKMWDLQLPKLEKEPPQVSFLVFTEQLLYHIIFGQLHCNEVTPVKKCNKQVLQKTETKIFDQKRFIKNLFKVNDKNKSGVLRINQIMSKLLTLLKR